VVDRVEDVDHGSSADVGDVEEPVTTSRYRVARMDCAAEEQLVRMRLAEVAEVDRVAVDLTRRQVVVEHRLGSDAVTAALASLGLDTELLDTRDADAGDVSSPGHDTTRETVDRADPRRERRGLWIALAINVAFFVGEMTFGILSRSMGLIADAVDMGADASVYALSLVAVGTSVARKKRLARASGYLQFGLATAGLVEVLRRFVTDAGPPDSSTMIVVASLALLGNVTTLLVLHRIRTGEAHMQASWIFTTNDVKANALVIVAAIAVGVTDSAVPDLVAGAVIFVIVANGARQILRLSR
jgi:cation transport ATPase